MSKHYDIIIVGGGMVGMTIACALAKQTSLSVLVLEASPVEPVWRPDTYYPRVSAIALSSKRIFDSIGIWPVIATKRISPFTQIDVWDARSSGKLSFDCGEINEPVLGYIVENAAIQASLTEVVKALPNVAIESSVTLKAVNDSNGQIELYADDGRVFTSALAVAADGGRSWLREQAGIKVDVLPYHQKGIVTTVKTALPHEQAARQVFLESGPLAFLPLQDAHTCSIVWTLPTEDANAHLELPEAEFKAALTNAFANTLGKVTAIEQRFAFPLQRQKAKTYLANRIVLAGDAAHTVHPLAGQGVNMGLLDAASLVEVIAQACRIGKDYSAPHVLRRYERWRKADNANMMVGMDVIKDLFATDKRAISGLRATGMSLIGALPSIRSMFTRHAVGNRDDLPIMAR